MSMVEFIAVKTTGIYCRPECPARPRPENTLVFELAAAAEAAGFRPCLRCRPHWASAPSFLTGPDIVCRAVAMILDGYLDSSTEETMARHLGVSSRHLRRLCKEHLGVTPNQLAQSSRAHFARRLLDDSDLTVTEIAFAAGFGSARQMNRVFKEIFRSTPTELRSRRRRSDRLAADGGLALRLPFDGPFDWDAMTRYLRPRAIPGVEHVTEQRYTRTVVVDGDPGVLEMEPLDNHLLVMAHLPHWEGLIHIARHATAMFGLNTSTDGGRAHLSTDPLLGPLVAESPGTRVPGTWDPFETSVVAILAQELTLSRATEVAGRIARRYGRFVPGLTQLGLTSVFPEPSSMMSAGLAGLGLSEDLRQVLRRFSTAAAEGNVYLDPHQDMDELIASLVRIPGVEETTAHYVAFRLGFSDAFPSGHPDVARALRVSGVGSHPDLAERWRPWRSLAAAYLIGGYTRPLRMAAGSSRYRR